jgi:hypothetical protein
MWWDTFPSIGSPDDPNLGELQDATLAAMRSILNLDSVACQESALHGLGHWQYSRPDEVASIIDGFIAESDKARPELLIYARSARSGCIL